MLSTIILYACVDDTIPRPRPKLIIYLAQSLATKAFSTFLKRISKTNNPDPLFSNKVVCAVGASDICDFWFNYYKTLFTSVGYNDKAMRNIFKDMSPYDMT